MHPSHLICGGTEARVQVRGCLRSPWCDKAGVALQPAEHAECACHRHLRAGLSSGRGPSGIPRVTACASPAPATFFLTFTD